MENDNIPKVSIILLNYNGARDTIECLKSLEKVTYSNYNIIIVDNASPDNSVDMINEFLTSEVNGKNSFFETPFNAMRNSNEDVKFTFIQSGFNGGYGHGNNIGIKYALKNGADYILLLNNDTIVDSNFLESMVKMCEDDDNIGIASGQIFFEDRPNIFWFNGGTYNYYTGKIKHINYNEINNGQTPPENITFITGCLWLIPKNVFQNVGYINEEYFMYVEDLEFSQRVLNAGLKLEVSNKSHIFHKVGSSSGGEITNFSMYWMTKNRIRFMIDNTCVLYWPLYLFNNVFVFSIKWLLTGQIDMLKVQINATIDFILKR